MPDILGQTDGNASCGVIAGCSGLSVTTGVAQSCELVDGAATGSTEKLITINSSETNVIGYVMQTVANVPNATDWPGSLPFWNIRFNVTSGANDVTWASVFICRFDNACGSLAVVGSATPGTSLMSAGVKTLLVTGSARSGSLSDEVYIILAFTNSNPMFARTFGITADQVIDTPIPDSGTTVVGESIALNYDLLALVNESVALNYGVLALANESLALNYDMAQLANESIALVYDMSGSIGESIAIDYDLFNIIGESAAFKYDLLDIVGESASFNYDLFGLASESLALQYDVRQLVNESLAFVYDMDGSVGESVALDYDLFNIIGESTAFQYDLFNVAAESVVLQYDTQQFISESLALLYDMDGSVGESIAINYDMLETVGESAAFQYDVLVTASEALSLLYDLRQLTGESLSVVYDLSGSVGESFSLVYDIQTSDLGVLVTKTCIATMLEQINVRRLEMIVGDIGGTIRLSVRGGSGVSDISSATTKEIKLQKPDETVLTKSAVFTTDGTDGLIEYVTVDGDIDQKGDWRVQAHIITPTQDYHTSKNTLVVDVALGG